MSRPKQPDPDETASPGSSHTPILAFANIRGVIGAVVRMWGHLGGFTYSPKSGLVYDVRVVNECLALFLELIRGNRDFRADLPIYLIATSNHRSIAVDDYMRDKYEEVAKFSNQPLIGYWKDSRGVVFLDIVAAIQFISLEDAVAIGKKYGQEYILAIWPDGSYEHTQTD